MADFVAEHGLGPYPPAMAEMAKPSEHPRLVAMVFASRSGGPPHVVTLVPYDPPQALCSTCMTVLSLRERPAGCHAAAEARTVWGLEEP